MAKRMMIASGNTQLIDIIRSGTICSGRGIGELALPLPIEHWHVEIEPNRYGAPAHGMRLGSQHAHSLAARAVPL